LSIRHFREDQLAKKYDSRFDISCDKDAPWPVQVTGWVDVRVFAIDPCKLSAIAPQPVASVATRLVRFTAIVSRTGSAVARSQVMARGGFRRWGRA
jgi:hypothetical protein